MNAWCEGCIYCIPNDYTDLSKGCFCAIGRSEFDTSEICHGFVDYHGETEVLRWPRSGGSGRRT